MCAVKNNHNTIVEKRANLSTHKWLLAILSGLMLTASFPPGKLSWIAWFAIVPLLRSLDNESPFQAFKLGFIAGTTHYITLIYWIVVVLEHYGNLNPIFSLGTFLLLCLYLALYLAFFSSITTFLKGSRFVLIFTASLWVGLEYLRANLLTGFPWCLLGYTQYKHLHLIQIADLCGVYGLSFFIILLNVLLYHIFFKHRNKSNVFLKWEILAVVFITGGILTYGHYRLSESQLENESRQHIKIAVIQANIDQSIKWDPAYQSETISTYQRLARASFDFKPEVIIWPETAVPFFFQNNVELSPKVFSLAIESGAILIFGSPAYKRIGGVTKFYNRAYLLTPKGQPSQFYDKVHLVPFGEYVPLKRLLFFINRLVPAAGDFEEGDKITPLNHSNLSFGTLICFEAIFPGIAHAHVRRGANILVNLTNDAWFGMTSAPYQHLCMAVFRSVENRRPMIRAANTGFSAYIAPQGEIVALSNLFCQDCLKISIDLSRCPLTFYVRFGDLFAISLLVISFIKVLSCLWTKWIKPGQGHMTQKIGK